MNHKHAVHTLVKPSWDIQVESHVTAAGFVSKFTKFTPAPPSASFLPQICWHAGTFDADEGQLLNTGTPCTLGK